MLGWNTCVGWKAAFPLVVQTGRSTSHSSPLGMASWCCWASRAAPVSLSGDGWERCISAFGPLLCYVLSSGSHSLTTWLRGWALGCGEEPQHQGSCTEQWEGCSCSSVMNYFFCVLFCSWHPGLSPQRFVVSLLWLKSGARHMASYVKLPAKMGWRDKLGQTCIYCNCLSSLIQAVQEIRVVLGEPGQWKCEHTFIYSCQRCVWLQDLPPLIAHGIHPAWALQHHSWEFFILALTSQIVSLLIVLAPNCINKITCELQGSLSFWCPSSGHPGIAAVSLTRAERVVCY